MGSVLFVTRGAACQEGTANSGGCHQGELAAGTITWTRYAATGTFSGVTDDSHSVIDVGRQRAYYLDKTFEGNTSVPYLDFADDTVKNTATFSSPAANAARGHVFLHDSRYLVRIGASNTIFVFDPENAANGLVSVAVSGTAPTDRNNCWVPYGGNYYYMPDAGGSTLNKLAPPADPINGTWTYGTVTVTGDAVPAHATANDHYTSFCYVPAINCLAWFPGANNAPVLIKPE
jgi:hypothetical protein